MGRNTDTDGGMRTSQRGLDREAREAMDDEALELAADHGVSDEAAYRALVRHRKTPPPGRRSLSYDSYPVMRTAAPGQVSADAYASVRAAASSPGQQLPEELRDKLEANLGQDLSEVRVHTGAASAAAAHAVSAKAYTQGQDIHFAEGRYEPFSELGQRLLAHEVAHTVQQHGTSGGRQFKLEVSQPGDALERQADAFADAFVANQTPVAVDRGVANSDAVARSPGPGAQAATGAAGDRDAFSDAFNRHFAAQLHVFHTGGGSAAEAGPDVGPGHIDRASGNNLPASRLRRLFTSGQRAKLTQYFADTIIPDRLFNGDDIGATTAQQRIILSGHILATGTYRPGSFTQRMHARMCGHWANLVLAYAGAGDGGGRGIREQFDHEGNLSLSTGQRSGQTGGVISEEEYERDGYQRPDRSQVQMHGLSIDEINTLQAGDWLWYFNDNGGRGGNHSVIFSRWAGPVQTATTPSGHPNRYRRAICMSQRNPSAGGVEHTSLLGERFMQLEPHRRITPVTHFSRVSADSNPVRTAEDLRRVLGTGRDASRNERFITRLERRHHGMRLDFDALARDIRTRNAALLQQLWTGHAQRMTQGQVNAIRALNAEAADDAQDITTLVRLNDRLRAWIANADTLGEAEQAQRGRVETRRSETYGEREEERCQLAEQIVGYDAEIEGYERVQHEAEERMEELDVYAELRGAQSKRRQLRQMRRTWRQQRREAAREARPAITQRLELLEVSLSNLQTTINRLDEQHRANRVELREARRTARQQNRPIAIAERRRTRAERRLEQLEAQSGRYTVHSGNRQAFQGRGEARGPRRGLLSNLDPQPNWASLMIPAQGDGTPTAE